MGDYNANASWNEDHQTPHRKITHLKKSSSLMDLIIHPSRRKGSPTRHLKQSGLLSRSSNEFRSISRKKKGEAERKKEELAYMVMAEFCDLED
jgi:hypothetical protein